MMNTISGHSLVLQKFLMRREVSLLLSDQAGIKSDQKNQTQNLLGDLILLFCEKLEIDEADITETSSEEENVEILRELH